jgi:hypothetical protein
LSTKRDSNKVEIIWHALMPALRKMAVELGKPAKVNIFGP